MTYKKTLLLLFSFFLLIATSDTKAQNFEGIIYYEMPEMERMGAMKYMVKDSKICIGYGDGPTKAAMLFLPEESKIVILIDKMKGFMAMDYSEEDFSKKNTQFEIENTGQTKNIAGRMCEIWVMKSDEEKFETCISEELGTFMMPDNQTFHQNSPSWAKQMAAEGYMPLEVFQLDEKGEKMLVMRATKVEEKALESSLFEIPEGYRDMSNLMQGMMDRFQN